MSILSVCLAGNWMVSVLGNTTTRLLQILTPFLCSWYNDIATYPHITERIIVEKIIFATNFD